MRGNKMVSTRILRITDVYSYRQKLWMAVKSLLIPLKNTEMQLPARKQQWSKDINNKAFYANNYI